MIQVVDENDKIVGIKERNAIDPIKDIYRVAALWITNSKSEILLAQRTFSKDKDPGKWGPAVSGTVEEGETYETNIYKEAEEEIGLVGVKFTIGPKMRIRQPRNYFSQWFSVVLNYSLDQFKLQEDEVERINWVPERELAIELEQSPDKYTVTTSIALRVFKSNN